MVTSLCDRRNFGRQIHFAPEHKQNGRTAQVFIVYTRLVAREASFFLNRCMGPFAVGANTSTLISSILYCSSTCTTVGTLYLDTLLILVFYLVPGTLRELRFQHRSHIRVLLVVSSSCARDHRVVHATVEASKHARAGGEEEALLWRPASCTASKEP